ncbi:hypothetical protein [Nonomuraea endophytica]|uniref:Uncharacterized protein n=1 Tax=Nonomuraea endophytica TaxID=714136 RepID=A0A7W8AFB5_9ACTN|nr:hypothetical protein [Nonomuraea endophytica]MBB5085132.1 hypothetical protein [Nonomuraea endophytica]
MTNPWQARFGFDFDPRYRWPLSLLGIRPGNCGLIVTERALRVRFGPWQLTTGLHNVSGAKVTGPYTALKVIGPHVSLADRGLSFGTNTRRGLCVTFHQPVRGGEPTGLLCHPGLTVTVSDPDALAEQLRSHLRSSQPARG